VFDENTNDYRIERVKSPTYDYITLMTMYIIEFKKTNTSEYYNNSLILDVIRTNILDNYTSQYLAWSKGIISRIESLPQVIQTQSDIALLIDYANIITIGVILVVIFGSQKHKLNQVLYLFSKVEVHQSELLSLIYSINVINCN
jgi:hypothetical protein